MKIFFLILSFFLGTTCTLAQRQWLLHQIKKGETIESIAAQYGTTVEQIKKKNPKVRTFTPGTPLLIPAKKQYTEKSGDNNTITIPDFTANSYNTTTNKKTTVVDGNNKSKGKFSANQIKKSLKERYNTKDVELKEFHGYKYFEVKTINEKEYSKFYYICNSDGQEILKSDDSNIKCFIRNNIPHFYYQEKLVNINGDVLFNFNNASASISEANEDWTVIRDWRKKNGYALYDKNGNERIKPGKYCFMKIEAKDYYFGPQDVKYICVYTDTEEKEGVMDYKGMLDYQGNVLIDARFDYVMIDDDGEVYTYMEDEGFENRIKQNIRVQNGKFITYGKQTYPKVKNVSIKTSAKVAQTKSGSTSTGNSNSDKNKSVGNNMNEWDKFSQRLEEVQDIMKSGQVLKAYQHYVNYIKVLKSEDGDFLYSVADLTEKMRHDLNKYNRDITSQGNMFNAASVMAESYNLSLLDIEMNSLRLQFAIQGAQLGNEKAAQLLNSWGVQTNTNKPAGGNQNFNNNSNVNSYPNNNYQNSNNNETRKKQLLDNIATYEKRIREIESQKGNGIATNMMGNQTISNYQRMIQDAKRELRSMGYNIY